MTHLLLKYGTCACNAKKIHQQGFNDYSYFTNNDELANYYAEVVMELCEHGCDDYEIITCRVPKKALTVDYNSYKEPLTYFRDEYADSDEEWFEMLETGEIHEQKMKMI